MWRLVCKGAAKVCLIHQVRIQPMWACVQLHIPGFVFESRVHTSGPPPAASRRVWRGRWSPVSVESGVESDWNQTGILWSKISTSNLWTPFVTILRLDQIRSFGCYGQEISETTNWITQFAEMISISVLFSKQFHLPLCGSRWQGKKSNLYNYRAEISRTGCIAGHVLFMDWNSNCSGSHGFSEARKTRDRCCQFLVTRETKLSFFLSIISGVTRYFYTYNYIIGMLVFHFQPSVASNNIHHMGLPSTLCRCWVLTCLKSSSRHAKYHRSQR